MLLDKRIFDSVLSAASHGSALIADTIIHKTNIVSPEQGREIEREKRSPNDVLFLYQIIIKCTSSMA